MPVTGARANISSIPPSPPNRSSHSLRGLLAAARPMALERDVVPGGCDRGRVRRATAKSPGVTCRLKPHPRARPEPFRPLAFDTGDALACRRRVSASNASPSNGTDSLEQPPIWRMAARPVSGLLLLPPGATSRAGGDPTSVASTSQLTRTSPPLRNMASGMDSEPNGSRPRHRLRSRLVLRSSSVPPLLGGGLESQGGAPSRAEDTAVLDRRGVSSASSAADASRKTEEKA
jgi:hypothetical protein